MWFLNFIYKYCFYLKWSCFLGANCILMRKLGYDFIPPGADGWLECPDCEDSRKFSGMRGLVYHARAYHPVAPEPGTWISVCICQKDRILVNIVLQVVIIFFQRKLHRWLKVLLMLYSRSLLRIWKSLPWLKSRKYMKIFRICIMNLMTSSPGLQKHTRKTVRNYGLSLRNSQWLLVFQRFSRTKIAFLKLETIVFNDIS